MEDEQESTPPTGEMVVKSFEIEHKADDQQDDGFFRFRGLAAAFGNVDHGGDLIEYGAFSESLKTQMIAFFLAHDVSIPVGVVESAEEVKKGLFIKVKMPLDDTMVRDRIVPQMKAGGLHSMSVGIMINEFRYETRKGHSVRIISKATVYEVSLTAIPMNPKAKITALKEAGKGIDAEQARTMTKRAFEEMLVQYAPVSKKAATILASRLQGDPEPEQSDSAWMEKLTSEIHDINDQAKKGLNHGR